MLKKKVIKFIFDIILRTPRPPNFVWHIVQNSWQIMMRHIGFNGKQSIFIKRY